MRHDFAPGRLVAGLTLMAAAAVFIGDAAGAWTAPWYVAIPLVCGGLCLAGAVGAVTLALRTRRR